MEQKGSEIAMIIFILILYTIILNMIYMVDRRVEKVEKKLSEYFQEIDYHKLNLILKNRDNQNTDNPEDEVEKKKRGDKNKNEFL